MCTKHCALSLNKMTVKKKCVFVEKDVEKKMLTLKFKVNTIEKFPTVFSSFICTRLVSLANCKYLRAKIEL